MARILVVAELKCQTPEARQGVIDCLTKASIYAESHEPGVSRYMICLPADTSDTTTVWAIEEYANQAASDSHMETEGVKEMIAYMSNNPVLAGAPTIHQLSWLEGMEFTKDEVNQQTEPFILFAEIGFHEGKRDDSLQYWKSYVESSKKESGVFVYGFSTEEAKPDILFSVEIYESEKYLWDVHVKTDAVKEGMEKMKDMRKGLTLNKLRLHGGFMYKK